MFWDARRSGAKGIIIPAVKQALLLDCKSFHRHWHRFARGFFMILRFYKISKGSISDENAIQSYEIDPCTGRLEIVDPH